MIFEELGVKASEVLFFDDSLRNITAAHRLGVMTAMVRRGQRREHARGGRG